MKPTPYHSYLVGNLPKGCKLCVQGKKLVLFITGICTTGCEFCPVSDTKHQKDDIYADEWKIKNEKDVIQEAKLINAKGAGITGGDPLVKVDRCVKYIKLLKKEFGNHFHIHLYTPLTLVTKDNLNKLYDAGLDEIRFHPNLESNKLWKRIELAQNYDWDVGVEIPVIPKKETKIKKLITYIKDKVKFLNLNELEISDSSSQRLVKYKPKDDISYGVKGSEELAFKLLKFCEKTKLNTHYCTTTLKDKVQLGNRLKRRAKNIAQPYDIVKPDGTLVRGAIYLEELKPEFSYRKKLAKLTKKQRQEYMKELEKLKKDIQKQYRIRNNLIKIDEQKLRILTSTKKIKKIKNYTRAIVREYPTHDQMEVEVEFLR
tara:strand:- start:1157 stop:2272 length:1116 start_codon:yes stop_codon:yes gene_type:complete